MRARFHGDVGGAAAVSGSINLDGGEGAGASAPAASWFDWSIDYREFSQIYPGLAAEPEEPRAAVKAPVKAELPTLESDIAALVSATAGDLRHSENAAPRPRPAAHQVPQAPSAAPARGASAPRRRHFTLMKRKMSSSRLTNSALTNFALTNSAPTSCVPTKCVRASAPGSISGRATPCAS